MALTKRIERATRLSFVIHRRLSEVHDSLLTRDCTTCPAKRQIPGNLVCVSRGRSDDWIKTMFVWQWDRGRPQEEQLLSCYCYPAHRKILIPNAINIDSRANVINRRDAGDSGPLFASVIT